MPAKDAGFPHGTDHLVRLDEAALKLVFGRNARMQQRADDVQGQQRSELLLLPKQ